MGLLDGKTAIVTGAARGIGKAIALKFAQEGANIAFTDLVIDENAEATAKELEALGVKAKAYASNAANFEDTANVVAEIHKDFGRIDILVNNAGITRDGLMMRMSEQQWDMVINVNLKSAFNFVSAEKAANLPQQMIENIAKGRLGKFLKEVCLLNQEDIMDGKKTVREVLKEVDPELQIVAFKRFTLRAE